MALCPGSVHHRLEAVVGGHRGVVGRGDEPFGRRGAQVHAVRGALCGNHALQHVEGRLVCLVGEARGQRALQRGDAASVHGHLPVRGGQGRRRGQKRNCRRQRAAVQLGGLCGDSVVQGLDGSRVVAGGCRVHRQVRYLSVRGESQGQLPCGDVRAVSHLSVVQDLRDVAGDRSFKHVYICFRRRLSPADIPQSAGSAA